jgi:hypothetical protein
MGFYVSTGRPKNLLSFVQEMRPCSQGRRSHDRANRPQNEITFREQAALHVKASFHTQHKPLGNDWDRRTDPHIGVNGGA